MSFINFCGPQKTDTAPVKPVAKNEHAVTDLSKMTLTAVLDLKHRQALLLKSKDKLNRLPDKGARVQQLYDRTLVELERRANIEQAAALFSKLNIAERGIPALNALEWSNGSVDAEDLAAVDPMQDVIDSDDENEINLLRIIAGGNMHKRRVKVAKPPPSLITPQDLEDIKAIQAEKEMQNKVEVVDAEIINIDVTKKDIKKEKAEKPSEVDLESKEKPKENKIEIVNADIVNIDVTTKKLSSLEIKQEKTEKPTEVDEHLQHVIKNVEQKVVPMREKFKPYKTTITNVHDPEKERARKKSKNWENTAATPPAMRLKETQLLTLTESIDLQKSYLNNLKKFQEEQASERLAARMERLAQRGNIKLPSDFLLKTSTAFTEYRVQNLEGDLLLKEEDEVHDPTDEDRGGGVNYTYSE